jgi:hypothetical protein
MGPGRRYRSSRRYASRFPRAARASARPRRRLGAGSSPRLVVTATKRGGWSPASRISSDHERLPLARRRSGRGPAAGPAREAEHLHRLVGIANAAVRRSSARTTSSASAAPPSSPSAPRRLALVLEVRSARSRARRSRRRRLAPIVPGRARRRACGASVREASPAPLGSARRCVAATGPGPRGFGRGRRRGGTRCRRRRPRWRSARPGAEIPRAR